MKQRTVYTCPLEMVHDIIRGKWKPIILWQLGKKEQSLSELFHSIEWRERSPTCGNSSCRGYNKYRQTLYLDL